VERGIDSMLTTGKGGGWLSLHITRWQCYHDTKTSQPFTINKESRTKELERAADYALACESRV